MNDQLLDTMHGAELEANMNAIDDDPAFDADGDDGGDYFRALDRHDVATAQRTAEPEQAGRPAVRTDTDGTPVRGSGHPNP